MTWWGRWFTAYFCTSCDKRLSWHEVMYSHGTCPHCGHNDRSTVCDTRERAIRYQYEAPRWWPWWPLKRVVQHEMKDSRDA